jgi:polysaccharide biosynthesis/export protein
MHDEEWRMAGKRWKLVVGLWMVVATSLVFCGRPVEAAAIGVDASSAVPAAMMDGYRIGAGDVLAISVWKNEDLTRVVQVLPDGRISFPLIGEITVEDLTVAQLTKILREKIALFSPNPEISVEVQKVNSLMIYVVGRVNRPDRFMLNSNINVLQALALAGGLTPFAKRADIKVLREEKDGTKVYPFDYDAVTEDNALTQNIELRRGDVIVVP